MRPVIAVCGWIVLFVASRALAGEPYAAESLRVALDEGRLHDAYMLVDAAVAEAPDDPEVRYLAAWACVEVFDVDAAERHVAAGLRLGESAELLAIGASAALQRGDSAAARALVDRALALEPDAENVRVMRDLLDVSELARTRRPWPETDSPGGFVDQVFARIAGGASAKEIAAFFDPAFAGAELESVLAGIKDGVEDAVRSGSRYLGWVVDRDVRGVGDRAVVTVQFPIETAFSKEQVEQLELALTVPEIRALADPAMVQRIEAFPAGAPRRALLDRLARTRPIAVTQVEIEIASDGDRYRITDVRMHGDSLRARMAALVESAEAMQLVHDAEKQRDDASFHIAYVIVGVLVLGAALGGVLALTTRASGRRGPGRGTRRS